MNKGKRFAVTLMAAISITGCESTLLDSVGGLGTIGNFAGAGIILKGSEVFGKNYLVAGYVAVILGVAAEQVRIKRIIKLDETNEYAVLAKVDGQEYKCMLDSLTSKNSNDTCEKITEEESEALLSSSKSK